MIDHRFPLDWPAGWPRTPDSNRSPGIFRVSFARARDDLMEELRLLGAGQVILSTNVQLRRDGLPYAAAREPDDPGVGLYFQAANLDQSMACDKYGTVADNLRAIGLSVAALRSLDRYGASGFLDRAFAGFAALPSPDRADWRSVLGFEAEMRVTTEQVEAAYRRLARTRHPDRGGSDHAMSELTKARSVALKELSKR